MPYTVSFNEIDGIVDVRVSGLATRDDHDNARDEALRLCRENKCTKILVDLRRLDTSLSNTLGCFAFGESIAGKPPYVQIAHVMPTNVKAREDVRFTSTVEANRGILTGEFDTIEEARKWLLDKK